MPVLMRVIYKKILKNLKKTKLYKGVDMTLFIFVQDTRALPSP